MTTLRQCVVAILICWGIILNMTVGMVNFSAGAVILTASIIGGNLAQMTNTGVWGLALFTIMMGVLSGALTGLLYNAMRVPCMVLTIGMMLVFEALPRVVFSNGINLSSSYTVLAQSPWCYLILLAMLAIFYLLYNKTAFGHNLRAIGSNQAISNGFVSLGMSAMVRDITNGMVLLILLTISANQGLFERRKADRRFAEEANAAYKAAL